MGKGEDTREIILDEALAAASCVGLEGVSIGSLARAVGLSKSGLYAHFDSKENLQQQILERARDRFIEAVWVPALRASRGEPRVREIFDRWLQWETASFLPGGCPFVAAASELDDCPGPVRDYLVETQREWLAGLAGAARIAIAEGHFRGDLDPEQFAYQLYSTILAYHHLARLLRDPRAEERARTAFESLLDASRRELAITTGR